MAPLIRRSNLIVPVTNGRAVEGSWRNEADAVTLDLGSGVAGSRKAEARSLVPGCIQQAVKGGAEVFVRVNRAFVQADTEAAVGPGLSGIVLPGVESAAEVEELSALLGRLEASRGLAAGELQIIALLETALGIWNVREILACNSRVTQAGIDEGALAANSGIYPDSELDPFVFARGRLAIEATALEVQPVGVAYPLGVHPRPLASEEMLNAAADSKNLGFKGMFCPDASWVAPVNEAFTPTETQVEYYTQVREVFAQGVAAGTAAVPFHGRMIDVPVDEWAKVVLETAEACHRRNHQKQEALEAAAAAG